MQYKRRPGSQIISAKALVNEENKKISNDTLNRDFVVRTVVSYIKNGISEEEALDRIMQNDIVKEFEYLKKNGLKIKECFRAWVRREIEKPRRTNERTR